MKESDQSKDNRQEQGHMQAQVQEHSPDVPVDLGFARRMFDQNKLITFHDEDDSGNGEDIIELDGIRTICYNLGIFYTQQQLLTSLSDYGATADTTSLTFHCFVNWWQNHTKLQKMGLSFPSEIRRFEAMKVFHGADRTMQGYVEENVFRHVFKSLVEKDIVQPASPSLRAWTPSHSTALLANTIDDPQEYTACLESIRHFCSDRKSRANYAFVPHPGDATGSVRAIQYPDFLSWVDATADLARKEQQEDSRPSLLSSVATGVSTLFGSTGETPADDNNNLESGFDNSIPRPPRGIPNQYHKRRK